MAHKDPDGLVGQINLNMLRAGFGFALGFGAWQLRTSELLFMEFLAALCVTAGAWRLLLGILGLVQLLADIGWGKLAKYRRKGAKPKSDRTASERDLKKRGLLK